MELNQIYQKLKDKFGEQVLQISTDVSGDTFCIIKREAVQDICKFMRDDLELSFDFVTSVCGVDDGKTLWVVYHLYSIKNIHKATLKVDVGRETPSVSTVTNIWRGANWHERETYDLLGIRFEGHPDLQRILLPDDWEGHPLRKDYKYPDDYSGIPLK